MYLVFRVLHHVTSGFSTEIFTYNDINAAKHQFHQVMATYAYGNNDNYDYVSGEVRFIDGLTVVGPEVDNRMSIEG